VEPWLPFVFAVAIGFAVAGIVASGWRLVAGDAMLPPARTSGALDLAAVLFVYAFGGPFLAAAAGFGQWRRGALRLRWLALVVVFCAAWSFCSGVLVLQALWVTALVDA
jgi:hypothetical protein